MQFLASSVSRKLTLLIVLVSGIITLAACSTLIILDVAAFRKYKTKQTVALGQVFAYDAAAVLRFGQRDMGVELLEPLRSHPAVSYAGIRDLNDNLFAEMRVEELSGDIVPPETIDPTDPLIATDDFLTVKVAIVEDGERLGTLYLQTSLADLQQQVRRNIGVAVFLMAFCLLMSVVLANFFQRRISAPILQLAETADRISQYGDYSLRVQTGASDEIGVLYRRFNEMLEHIEEGKRQLTTARDELEHRVALRTEELSRSNEQLQTQIREREQTARRLAETHDQLTLAARQAGMAEIASGVLHNVGNVLNSVNVSTSLVCDKIKHSRAGTLNKAVAMIQQHQDSLGDFLSNDDRGKLLPDYLIKVSSSVNDEHEAILMELRSLQDCVDHMKEVISKQQSFARFGGTRQAVDLRQLAEDAIDMNAGSLQRHGVKVERDIGVLTEVTTDKHKVLQVLVNLVKNAKDAIREEDPTEKVIRVSIHQHGDSVSIQVQDNGTGIALHHLDKMFQHGFTTKPTGHGFGLHSSALAAKEIGGSLSVKSDGPGTGATFILKLPIDIDEDARCQA